MAKETVRGRFVWHELMTTDTKSAAGFLTKLIGWKTQVSAQDKSYTMFVVNGRPVAGLMALSAEAKAMGAPPNWLAYISTPNVDETARQAESLGGKILKFPADIPTVGRFAVLQDPQGAVFAAFTPAPTSQGDAAGGLGDFSWHELLTSDGPAAFAFYQRLFGWEATSSMDMGPQMGVYQMFGLDKKAFGGIFKPPQAPGPPTWLSYIQVADAKASAAAIKKLGAEVINGPMEVPDGDWITQGLDLQGAMFAVHSKKPVAPSKPVVAKKAKPTVGATAKAPQKTAAKKAKARKAKPGKRAKAAKKVAKRTKAPARRRASKRGGSKKRRR